MSPFDIAAFAIPISFIMAIFSGPSCMLELIDTDFAMFSLVQAIIAADAGDAIAAAARTSDARIMGFINGLHDLIREIPARTNPKLGILFPCRPG